LRGSTVILKPYGRGVSAVAEVVLIGIWATGIISFLSNYPSRESQSKPALFLAVILIMTLGAAALIFLLLWTTLGSTIIEVSDSMLAREFRIGPIRVGSRREFARAQIRNLRASNYTVRRRSGVVTRYALDFDYDGKIVRLFHDRVPERVRGLLDGPLKGFDERATVSARG
jgi:hypothetical protein